MTSFFFISTNDKPTCQALRFFALKKIPLLSDTILTSPHVTNNFQSLLNVLVLLAVIKLLRKVRSFCLLGKNE